MSDPPVQPPSSFRYPYEQEISKESPGAQAAHRGAFQGIVDLNQAIRALKGQVNTVTNTVNNQVTVVSGAATPGGGGGGGGGGGSTSSIGLVNNQLGSTDYATQQSDYGAFIILGASAPIAVSLTGDTPPAIDANSKIGSVNSDFPGKENTHQLFIGHSFAAGGSTASQNLKLRVAYGDIVVSKAYQTAVK